MDLLEDTQSAWWMWCSVRGLLINRFDPSELAASTLLGKGAQTQALIIDSHLFLVCIGLVRAFVGVKPLNKGYSKSTSSNFEANFLNGTVGALGVTATSA